MNFVMLVVLCSKNDVSAAHHSSRRRRDVGISFVVCPSDDFFVCFRPATRSSTRSTQSVCPPSTSLNSAVPTLNAAHTLRHRVRLTMSSSDECDGNHTKKKRRLNLDSPTGESSSEDYLIKVTKETTKTDTNRQHRARSTNNDTGTVAKQKEATAISSREDTTESISPPITTLYIGNLHPRIQQPHVEKLLGKYGKIERLDFLSQKGICFCQFSNDKEAKSAMTSLNKQVLLGRTLKVQLAKQQSRSDGSPSYFRSSRAAVTHKTCLDSKIQALKRKLNEKKKT